MSAEARILQLIDDAVRTEMKPLKVAVRELNARLAAVEGERGTSDEQPQKRPTAGRTAKPKAEDATAADGDGSKATAAGS